MTGMDLEAPAREDVPLRSRLLLATAERDRLEEVLRKLPRAVAGGSPRAVAEVLAEDACLLAGARMACVVLPEPDPVVVTAGPDAHCWGSAGAPARWPIVVRALGGGASYVPDLGKARRGRWTPLGCGGEDVVSDDGRSVRSLGALPVRGDGQVRAALVVAHHRAFAFSERQFDLLEACADHLGRVLDLCEAVREQTSVATALQETLLPPVLPVVDGVELAARYRPSGSGNLVGGDFYDVFADGAGGWWLLLGDACGIGPEAAGLAGVARYTARALAESASGPLDMLARLNRALLRAAPEDRFCTAVLAHLRAASSGTLEVECASAGHPTPYLLDARGAVEPVMSSTGLVLGILPDAPAGTATFLLEPGDAFVCYTDGVIEAHAGGGEQFGEERLVRVLADAQGRSATGTARRVERAVVDHRSPDDHDDLAVVVVRCRPAS